MARKRQLDDKRKEDRALALLSLVADRPGLPGPCPNESELAQLVDGRLNAEERLRLQHHLSICGDCYRQWLTLSQAAGRRMAKGRPIRSGRFRRVGYFGTALALAASVAVFLNIYHQAGLTPPVEPTRQVLLQKSKEAAPKTEEAASAPSEPQHTATDTASRPAPVQSVMDEKPRRGPAARSSSVQEKRILPAAPVVPLKAEKPRKELPAGRSAAMEKRALPAASPPPAVTGTAGGVEGMVRQQDRMADEDLAAPAAPAESPVPNKRAALAKGADDTMRWLDKVREGCRSGRLDRDFWIALHATGEELSRNRQSEGDGAHIQTAKVAAILPLLVPLTDTRPDPKRLASQCWLLQGELAKEGVNSGAPTSQRGATPGK